MAEVGIVASLLGISTFGIKLTTTLYKFGSTASSAREQTDYIARHVTLYSDVLELLAQRIDDDEPIHSRKALDLVYDVYDQSFDLFDNIRDLLPDRAEKMSFMQKIRWNFRKTKVDLLVSEIEYLKSTVNLLVSVLYAGKKIRTRNRKRESKKAEKDAKAQFARAQNAIVEQVNATTAKENLQAKVEEEDQIAVEEATGTDGDRKSTAVIKHAPQIAQLANNTAIVRFQQSLGEAKNLSEERSLVMSNSIILLEDLLHQWTNLAEDNTTAATEEAEPSTTRATNEPTPKEVSSTTNTGAEDSEDVWRETYFRSQTRVKELEAELLELKTAAETKLESERPARRNHEEYETRARPRNSSAKTSAAPTKDSNLKDGDTQGQGFGALPSGGGGDSGWTFNFSDPNAIYAQFAREPSKSTFYGGSGSITPGMREKSPSRNTESRYPVTAPTEDLLYRREYEADDYEHTPRSRELYDNYNNIPRYRQGPEPVEREFPRIVRRERSPDRLLCSPSPEPVIRERPRVVRREKVPDRFRCSVSPEPVTRERPRIVRRERSPDRRRYLVNPEPVERELPHIVRREKSPDYPLIDIRKPTRGAATINGSFSKMGRTELR